MNSSEIRRHGSPSYLLPPPIWVLFFFTLISSAWAAKFAMAHHSETKGYIVFTDQPQGGQDLRDYAIHLLTSVLGSKKAAEEALGYVYRNVGPGFSASLTPKQAVLLRNQPGVVFVKESERYDLWPPGSGGGGGGGVAHVELL